MAKDDALIWSRVSGDQQENENQVLQLLELAKRRGLRVVGTYRVEESAWKGAHEHALSQIIADARKGKFGTLLTWSLDRLERRGAYKTLEVVHRLAQSGIDLISLQEPWVEAAGPTRELLLSITGWIAEQESARRSERTRAGLERVRASGVKLGRPVGAKDKRRRSRTGYYLRYQKKVVPGKP